MSLRFHSLALAGALAFAAPATVLATPTAPTVSDASRYADREAKDTTVAEYEGGSTFVITMSGTTLAIILVLLILL